MIDAAAMIRLVAACALTGLLAPAVLADGGVRGDDPTVKQQEEREMLDRARREALERRAPNRLEVTVTPSPRTTVNIGEPAPSERAGLEARRRAELDNLSNRIRQASQMRTRAVQPVETPWTTEVVAAPREPLQPNHRSALGRPAHATAKAERVTVLMVMAPGNRGIRRFEKTADPILCVSSGCYISNGHGLPARFLSAARSLSLANSFGQRAGACRNQTGCVFRDIDLGEAPAFVRPIDLRLVHHDRREAKSVAADDTCRVRAGRLTCGAAIRSDDYTLWVVPESVAAEAGPEALLRAVDEGLAVN